MIKHHPKNEDLLNIQCLISPETDRIIAEIATADGIKLIGYRIPYPTGNTAKDTEILERKLVEEIKVYLLLESVLAKCKEIKTA